MEVQDRLELLPARDLDGQVWGIACLSVSSGREQPEHKAEMGTQILMGDTVRVLKCNRTRAGWPDWYLVQSSDGYLSWLEMGTFVRCTEPEAQAWRNSELLVVTALEDLVLARPEPGAETVSDVVVGDLLKKVGVEGTWLKVELPDRRAGYLPASAGEDYLRWKQSRRATPESIEATARRFLGRPYLWGANSPKGLDCSGLSKMTYLINGIALRRNASHQANEGREVPLDANFSHLHKGDLLFFGRPARGSQPERVVHVGIYLGDKLFIHSSERVQINSLDPASPLRDELRIRTLLRARRILPE